MKGRVINVVDGDTIDIRTKSREIRVRLIGIDTPEVYNGPECGGQEASAAMRAVAGGKRVSLRTDPTQDRRDRYGRLLAYVRPASGPSVQVEMLSRGWAEVYVYDTPFRKLSRYIAAAKQAIAAGLGGWFQCGWSPSTGLS